MITFISIRPFRATKSMTTGPRRLSQAINFRNLHRLFAFIPSAIFYLIKNVLGGKSRTHYVRLLLVGLFIRYSKEHDGSCVDFPS